VRERRDLSGESAPIDTPHKFPLCVDQILSLSHPTALRSGKRERVVMTAKNTWILTKAASSLWVDDYAQSMGRRWRYTMLSIAPCLLR